MTPLLALRDARIDSGGAALLDGVSFESSGQHLGLVGSWEPLFALAAGRAHLAAGTLTIRGRHPRRGVQEGRIGLALADVALPEAWTALAYVEQSAELLGLGTKAARAAARTSLGAAGLPHLESRRIGTLTLAERRAVLVAHAMVGGPEVLLLEAPLTALDTQSERLVSETLDRAAAQSSLLVSVPAPAPVGGERVLLERLGEVAVVEAGALVASGGIESAIQNRARYAVTVLRHGSELASRLTELGLVASVTSERAEGARLSIDLGETRSTDDVLDAALAVDAPIVELLPQ